MAQETSTLGVDEARWGPVALAALMTGWSLWFLYDAYSASPRFQNMIFIAPGVVIMVLLFALILLATFRRKNHSASMDEVTDARVGSQSLVMPVAVMILLLLYVFTLPVIGFDVATFLFIAGTLLAQGERRPLVVILYSAVFAGIVVWGFTQLLTLDMPTRIL